MRTFACIVGAFLSLELLAQDFGRDVKCDYRQYCAEWKRGQVVMTDQGQELTQVVTLNNGSVVAPTGLLIDRKGHTSWLDTTYCVCQTGRLIVPDRRQKTDDYRKLRMRGYRKRGELK